MLLNFRLLLGAFAAEPAGENVFAESATKADAVEPAAEADAVEPAAEPAAAALSVAAGAVLRATFVSAVVVAKSAVVNAEFVVVVIAAIQATADRLHRSELGKFMEIALAWHWQLHLEIVVGVVTVGMAGDKGALHKKGLINAGVACMGAGLYFLLLLITRSLLFCCCTILDECDACFAVFVKGAVITVGPPALIFLLNKTMLCKCDPPHFRQRVFMA